VIAMTGPITELETRRFLRDGAMPFAMSATPMHRPDYKAKKHSKPIKWRPAVVRQACELAVARALGVAL